MDDFDKSFKRSQYIFGCSMIFAYLTFLSLIGFIIWTVMKLMKFYGVI